MSDACASVDVELNKVIDKFTQIQGHSKEVLGEVIASFEELQTGLKESK